jgi:5-methylthioadenosine/S-adenosylhomocysteine deaminase
VLPVKLLAGWAPTARAIVRYVEAKALMGGTTTGQGIRTQVRGGVGLFRGAMRNVESTDDPRLPEAATLVPTMGRQPEDVAAFRAALEKRAALGGGYFYHLAEGTDELARRTYTDLRDNGLLRAPLVAIHALALRAPDLRVLRGAGAKLVWSPFSNLLLYGQTLDLRALLASRARFAIGCDWAPSGSRNLLHELKVARHVVRVQGLEASLGGERLVRAVTADAAAILGWSRHVGAVRPGAMADLLVVAGSEGDDYARLIDATERDVRLVVVHGTTRYGERRLMESLDATPGQPLETLEVDGTQKAFQLASPASPLNGLTLAEATRVLRSALADLHAFRDLVTDGTDRLRALGVQPQDTFSLVLDNEGDGGGDDVAFRDVALTDFSLLPPRLELDGLVVGGEDYWSRIVDQRNIDRSLKEALRVAYSR